MEQEITLDTQGDNEDVRLRRAFEQADAMLSGRAQQAGTERRSEKGILTKAADVWKSSGTGIAKAGFETYDFIFGEPQESDKSALRRGVEQRGRELAAESPINSLAMGVSQFATGLIGAGKIMGPIKAVQKLEKAGKAGRAAVEVAKGAAAGTVVLDPHEERLSNLVQQFPALRNPVTEYLAADSQDSAAEGRFKNALEGIGLDIAIVGTFAAAAKALKLYRAGDGAGAAAELSRAQPAETPTVTQESPLASGEPQAAPSGPPTGKATSGAPVSQAEASPQVLPQIDPDRLVEFEERAATLEHDGGLPRAEAERLAANELDIVPPQEAGSGAFPASLPTEGSTTPARPSAITSEASESATAVPGAKEADGAIASPSSPPLSVSVTPDDVSAILKATGDDLDAITKYGSREAALEAGAVLSRGSRLPWQKLQAPDDLRTFMDNTASTLRRQMDTAKGGDILKDTALTARVQQMADYFGEAPEMLLGDITKAGEAASGMVAKMEAAYRISNAMFQDVYGVAFKVRNGMLDEWGGDAAKAGEELRSKLTIATSLLASAKAVSSNSGRALRRMRGQFRLTPEDLAGIKALDTDRMADLIAGTQGDPRKLAQVASPGFFRRVVQEGSFLFTNNLLWGYPTHLMNLTSSLFMVAGRPAEKLLGSYAIGGNTGSIIRRQAAKEFNYTVAALGDAWSAAAEAFLRGDSILSPHNTEYFNPGSSPIITQQRLAWKKVETITDLAENAWKAANYRNVIGLPTRSLGAADEFFKTLRYRAVVQAEAATRAEEMGLSGLALRDYVRRALDNAIDAGTGQALDQRALQEAQIATFQQELLPGTIGATVQQVRSRHPITTFVLPFVKTPINVLRYGIKMTPGLNLLQAEYRELISGAKGAEAQAQAVGQMMLGSLFMGLVATMALDGRITGGGPQDPNLRQQLAATGWQPYSYVMEGDDGSKTYIPMGRLDPVGMAFGMVASLAESIRLNPDDGESGAAQGILAASLSLARNFGDRTFLQNIHQAVQALTDPGSRGEKWLGNLASNLVPASSLLRTVNPDEYLREARDFTDSLTKSLPGMSDKLPPVRDAFGEPAWRRIGLATSGDADIVEAEHNRIIMETGRGIQKPSPAFEGIDLRDILLTDGKFVGRNAYDVLQELAGHIPGQKPLKERLARLIESDNYQERPDGDSTVFGTRINALSSEVQRYREAAKKYLLIHSKELREMRGQRKRDARAARIQKRHEEGRMPEPMKFMDIPGVSPIKEGQ